MRTVTCGLVAQRDILFPYWYETMPDDQIVQAALLSQNGGRRSRRPVGPQEVEWTKNYRHPGVWSWKSSSYTLRYKDSVTLKGARAMKRMLGFSAGYDIRNFDKDPVLANNPPPLYPKLAGRGAEDRHMDEN